MIRVTDRISLDDREIKEKFVRSSGPGGQNVNKTSTAVELRFDVKSSPSLPERVRSRLMRLAGSRMNADGILVIDARQFRTQEANRKDALVRLATLIRKASEEPRLRKKTRPSAGSKERRIQAKRRRADVKRTRKAPRERTE